ncbi:hypothetical protein M885DRAFT_511085 [Pelagophyceae sp. CCMP2097]|nr:hypothetical protein M885DRAFT_511085 [Pelagophyceae sp. CCMP2097]
MRDGGMDAEPVFEERGSLLRTAEVQDSERGGARSDGRTQAKGPAARSEAQPTVFDKGKFFFMLLVYMLPLMAALGLEGVFYGGATAPTFLEATMRPASLLATMSLFAGLVAGQRIVAARLRWKMKDMPSDLAKENLLRLGCLSALLCVAGRVGTRMEREPLAFSALVVFYTALFGWLFERIKHADIEFTRKCVSNPAALTLAALVVVLAFALISNHLSNFAVLERLRSGETIAVPSCVGVAIIVVGFHAALVLSPGDAVVHWHHWYTAFFGANFCVLDSTVSMCYQAMLVGIFLHGAALFGVEQCFYPGEARAGAAH